MAGVKELLRTETDGSISFGDYELDAKKKVSDYEYRGDVYKVKTFRDMTKLERNELLVYESVPGTAVTGMYTEEGGVSFFVEGERDAQIILNMTEGAAYRVSIDGTDAGVMETSMGGKLSFYVELDGTRKVKVEVVPV